MFLTSFLELDYSKLPLACLLAKGKTHEVKGFERSENQANEVRRPSPLTRVAQWARQARQVGGQGTGGGG